MDLFGVFRHCCDCGVMLLGFATLAKSRDGSREERACPVCGEQILAVAAKCKHCGSMIAAQDKSNEAVLVDEPSDGNPLRFSWKQT